MSTLARQPSIANLTSTMRAGSTRRSRDMRHTGFPLAIALAGGLAACDSEPRQHELATTDGTCTIAAAPVARLTGDHVQRGIVVYAPPHILLQNQTDVAVFDTAGRHLRTLGRSGSGPGEFVNIAAVLALPGQRVAIIDGSLPRLTILDEHGGLLSTAPLPFATRYGSAMRLPDDTYVLMGRSVESISLFGHPMVRIRADGTTLHFFGEDETEKEEPLEGTVMHRLIAWDAGREAIVAVKRFKYDIELWSPEGELMTTIRRDVEWFDWPPEPLSKADPHLGASSPENMVRAVQVDGAGRLWVILHITSADFDASAWLEHERTGQTGDYNRFVDSQIEVIDLDSGSVECSATFDPAVLSGFSGDGQIATYEEDGGGNPAITLWQLNMVLD